MMGGLEAGEAKDLLNELGKAATFVADEGAVALDVSRLGGNPIGEVFASRADDGERGTEFVGDASDEIHLQLGKLAGAAGGKDEEGKAEGEGGEGAGADGKVPAAGVLDELGDRAGAMLEAELAGSWGEGGRRGAEGGARLVKGRAQLVERGRVRGSVGVARTFRAGGIAEDRSNRGTTAGERSAAEGKQADRDVRGGDFFAEQTNQGGGSGADFNSIPLGEVGAEVLGEELGENVAPEEGGVESDDNPGFQAWGIGGAEAWGKEKELGFGDEDPWGKGGETVFDVIAEGSEGGGPRERIKGGGGGVPAVEAPLTGIRDDHPEAGQQARVVGLLGPIVEAIFGLREGVGGGRGRLTPADEEGGGAGEFEVEFAGDVGGGAEQLALEPLALGLGKARDPTPLEVTEGEQQEDCHAEDNFGPPLHDFIIGSWGG
jgi:hypothetical protein